MANSILFIGLGVLELITLDCKYNRTLIITNEVTYDD